MSSRLWGRALRDDTKNGCEGDYLLCGIVKSQHCLEGGGASSHCAHNWGTCPKIYVPHCRYSVGIVGIHYQNDTHLIKKIIT